MHRVGQPLVTTPYTEGFFGVANVWHSITKWGKKEQGLRKCSSSGHHCRQALSGRPSQHRCTQLGSHWRLYPSHWWGNLLCFCHLESLCMPLAAHVQCLLQSRDSGRPYLSIPSWNPSQNVEGLEKDAVVQFSESEVHWHWSFLMTFLGDKGLWLKSALYWILSFASSGRSLESIQEDFTIVILAHSHVCHILYYQLNQLLCVLLLCDFNPFISHPDSLN